MGRGTSGTGGGSGSSSGQDHSWMSAKSETTFSHGSAITGYVVNSEAEALGIASTAPFEKSQDTDYHITERDSPATMKHYDAETITMRKEGDKELRNVQRGYYMSRESVSVEHKVLVDGTSLYTVDASPSTMEALGFKYTRGARGARNRSGYLFNSRSEARSAARQALKYEIRNSMYK